MPSVKAFVFGLGALAIVGMTPAADPGAPAASAPWRRVRLDVLDRAARIPADLLYPEGKSRWDLRQAPVAGSLVRTFSETTDGMLVQDVPDDARKSGAAATPRSVL
jgi:hypothetical protein